MYDFAKPLNQPHIRNIQAVKFQSAGSRNLGLNLNNEVVNILETCRSNEVNVMTPYYEVCSHNFIKVIP